MARSLVRARFTRFAGLVVLSAGAAIGCTSSEPVGTKPDSVAGNGSGNGIDTGGAGAGGSSTTGTGGGTPTGAAGAGGATVTGAAGRGGAGGAVGPGGAAGG